MTTAIRCKGESIGVLTKGEAIIKLMNELKYDVVIPGNHEFDYGMEQSFNLVDMAEFPYISCNFVKEGELVFKPWTIVEAARKKIGFVGVTTPETMTSSNPKYFENEKGDKIYGYMQEKTAAEFYSNVQEAIDGARSAGADYIYVMGHLGYYAMDEPWTYASVIENTTGIDVFFDGHSHDTEQVIMKDKAGRSVTRSACGTKLSAIGYSHITPDEGIVETGLWSWPNSDSVAEIIGIRNSMSDKIDEVMLDLSEKMNEVIAKTDVDLTISDPVEKDSAGNPIRMVRRADTNLSDLVTDAIRYVAEADIAFVGGGSFRKSIEKGDITYGEILDVLPYGNNVIKIDATGQQILDALEWGVQALPEEFGGFPQVSGMTYEIDVNVPSGCITGDDGMMMGIEGDRRIKNVMIGGEPLDPAKKYTVAGVDYTLVNHGDGYTAFDGAPVLLQDLKVDYQALIDYITEVLGGEVGEGYDDPYGQGRIVFAE